MAFRKAYLVRIEPLILDIRVNSSLAEKASLQPKIDSNGNHILSQPSHLFLKKNEDFKFYIHINK